jgi:hypothetical protein
VSTEPQLTAVFRGVEQDKARIQSGYHQVRQLLLSLIGWSKGKESEFKLEYIYEKHRLSVLFGVPNEEAQLMLQNSIAGAHWEEAEIPVEHKNMVKLVGSADPHILDEREIGLIDELIESFANEDFIVQFVVKTVKPLDYRKNINILEGKIKKFSEEMEIQLAKEGHIGKKLEKVIKGGDNESRQEQNIKAYNLLQTYKHHYLSIKSAENYACRLFIYVQTHDMKLSRHISERIKAFSSTGGIPTGHIIRKEFIFGDEAKGDFSIITPNEVATLAAFPFKPRSGFIYRDFVRFGTEVAHDIIGEQKIPIGFLDTGFKTSIDIEIPTRDVIRHILVTGVTGSGKTTTIKHILSGCHQKKLPFLVIEPAKSEYRSLGSVDITVYRLGTYEEKPLKMNPLAFPDGIHVQTHLDLIKAVFNAAFPMYGPMPYLLETALLLTYQRCGWDLVTGLNIYYDSLPRENCFPTLEDLNECIDYVTGTAGYSKDLSSDVKAALKVRIGSLLVGAKGKILNTSTTLDMEQLLTKPAVIELEAIGDGQEKAFLMGLLLILVYEHYVARGADCYAEDLKHILVFEEAHRLWENRQEAASQEVADVKGYAVQTLNQILSEIRAYGQGILIADQIPSKLAPDVVKNTNIKILHRLFAQDDREWVGKAIGLNDKQINHLVHLGKGEAVVFWDRLLEAVYARIEVNEEILTIKSSLEENQNIDRRYAALNYLMANNQFLIDAERVLRTILLFPSKREQSKTQMTQIVERFLNISPEDEFYCNEVIVKIATKFVRYWKTSHFISLVEEYDMQRHLEQNIKHPYRAIADAWDEVIEKLPMYPVYSMIPLARGICILLPKDWDNNKRKEKLYLFLTKYWADNNNPIIRKNTNRYKEFSSLFDLGKYFNTEILSINELNYLADGVVVSLIQESTNILDYYLGVHEHNLSGDLLKVLLKKQVDKQQEFGHQEDKEGEGQQQKDKMIQQDDNQIRGNNDAILTEFRLLSNECAALVKSILHIDYTQKQIFNRFMILFIVMMALVVLFLLFRQ